MGKFVDKERPTFLDSYNLVHQGRLGEWPALETEEALPEQLIARG